MKYSIVTTLYKSEANISEFLDRVNKVMSTFDENFEIVIVDDGSPDRSYEIAAKFKETVANLRLLQFNKNYGHRFALLCGIENSEGEYVITIDSDLEERPEDIPKLIREIDMKPEIDHIFAVQETRKGKLIERITGRLYYLLTNQLNEDKIVPNQMTMRIFTRRFANSLLKQNDKSFTFFGLVNRCGYESDFIVLSKESRGNSNYTFRKKIELSFLGLQTTSLRIIYIIFFLGLSSLFVAFIFAAFGLIVYIRNGSGSGWLSIMFSIWFLGTLQILILSLIGLFLQQILVETKNNPRFELKS